MKTCVGWAEWRGIAKEKEPELDEEKLQRT